MTRRKPEHIVKRAERALGELELSVTTHADGKRIDLIRRGMTWLDEEQARLLFIIDIAVHQIHAGDTEDARGLLEQTLQNGVTKRQENEKGSSR